MGCIILQDLLSRSHWARRLGQLLVQSSDTLKAGGIFVRICPLDEHYFALLANLGIGDIVTGKNAQSLKEWFIGKSTLKAGSSVLDKTIQDD